MRVKKNRKKVVVAASIALALVGGAAFAYWTMRGSGVGTATTKANGLALIITQDAPEQMAPGDTIQLSGSISNPNTTSVKLGVLTPKITSAGTAKIADFKLSGKSSSDSILIPKNGKILWSGLTLEYLDSATENQDAGMNQPITISYAVSQFTAPTAGYNAIPSHVDGNVPSVGFQATSTSEFGDAVKLSGTERTITSMSAIFSSWGCENGSGTTCATAPGATFKVPVTFTVYAANSSGDRVNPGTPLSEKTENIDFAYRPSASPVECTDGNAGKWWNAKVSKCENGAPQLVTMTMPATSTLSDYVVWTVKFNTSTHGFTPVGTSAACFSTPGGCGYDSLNVGAQSFPGAPFSGTDLNEDLVYVDSSWSGQTADGWTTNRPLGAIATK